MKFRTFLKNVWPESLNIRPSFYNKNHLIAGFTLTLLLTPTSVWSQQTVDEGLRMYLEEALSSTESFSDRFEAEVWLVDMSSRLKSFMRHQSQQQRLELLKNIHKKATAAKLSPGLVLALIQTESSFDQFAVSSAGAQGLMQVMPFWKNVIGRPQDNLTDVETNLKYGSYILRYYLEKEKGNLTRALARYNGSLGKTWYPERVYKNWDRHWRND